MIHPGYRLTVRFYRSANGREPVREWLSGLSLTEKSQQLPAADLVLARSRMKEVRHG